MRKGVGFGIEAITRRHLIRALKRAGRADHHGRQGRDDRATTACSTRTPRAPSTRCPADHVALAIGWRPVGSKLAERAARRRGRRARRRVAAVGLRERDQRRRRRGAGAVSGPLEGIKVLDLTRLLPGAFATALLADLGADVLKVEQPGVGDPMRTYAPRVGDSSAFSWIADRNKRSIALNLRDPRGVEAIHRLARDADVLIEGFRPGRRRPARRRLRRAEGRQPARWCTARCRASARAGRSSARRGTTSTTSAARACSTGAPPRVQIGDLSGSLMAVSGLLAALVRAQRTGEGDHVDISITDARVRAALDPPRRAVRRRRALGPARRRLPVLPQLRLRGRQAARGRRARAAVLAGAVRRARAPRPGRDAVRPGRGRAVGRSCSPGARATRGWRCSTGATRASGRSTTWPRRSTTRSWPTARWSSSSSTRSSGRSSRSACRSSCASGPASVRTPAPALGEATRERLAAAGYAEEEIEQLLADGVAAAPPERMAAPQ